MQKITVETLKGLNACHNALICFERNFPDGANSWEEIAEHPQCKPKWKGWLSRYAPVDRELGLKLIEESDDPKHWRGMAAAYAHWVDRDLGLKLIEESDDPARWRGRAAAYAHWA